MLALPSTVSKSQPDGVRALDIAEFQRIVLRLGNQMFVRHYLWLNYPREPQMFGVQFYGGTEGGRHGRGRSCECGICYKCKHREYMNKPRNEDATRLIEELSALGFSWDARLKMWTVPRRETPVRDETQGTR